MNHRKKGGEGISGRRNARAKSWGSGKTVMWGNVKRQHAGTGAAERSLKILFYEMKSPILEKLSEM